MRLVEFVSEAQGPGIWSRVKAKFGSPEAQGQMQTQAEFSKIFKAFETWLGRSGLKYGDSLTVEKFKLNFGKTPNLDQALKDVGITNPDYKLKKPDVEKILYRVTQLKDQVVSKPVEPPAPDPAEEKAKQEAEKAEQEIEKLRKVFSQIRKIEMGTAGTEILNPKESKKIEKVIKTEVSNSRQKAIDVGIFLVQLARTYDVRFLAQLWVDAYRTGTEWETLKEVQAKVNLSET